VSDAEEPRTYAIRLHRRARADIDAIRLEREELRGGRAADEWHDKLIDALATLATYPKRCPLAREDRLFRREVRQFLYRQTRGGVAYRVLFTVYEAEDEAPFVFILHVRHGAQGPMTADEAQAIEEAD